MGSPAKRGAPPRWRRVLRLWHRWFGLGAAVWLLLLAVTGSAIVFYEEFDRALNPDWRSIPAASAPGTPAADRAVEAAARAAPGFSPRYIDLPDKPGETIVMLGEIDAPDGQGGPAQVFADPRDGRVLGWRRNDVVGFDRRHLMDTLYGLHVDLKLGPAMTWFLGLVGLLWAIDHIAAIILAIPSAKTWRSAFRIQGRGLNLRRIFDLHRAPGLWLAPVTLVVAVTGTVLAWPDDSREAVRLVAPVSERLHEHYPSKGPPPEPIGVDRAVAIATGHAGAAADSVLVVARKGVYGVRTFDDRDLDHLGRLWTYVAMEDGRILGQRHDNGDGAGDGFFAWQYPLHSGQALGLTGRLLVLASGVATVLLCVTGVVLWARRRPGPRRS